MDGFLVPQVITLHVQFGDAGLGEQKSVIMDYIFRVTTCRNPTIQSRVSKQSP